MNSHTKLIGVLIAVLFVAQERGQSKVVAIIFAITNQGLVDADVEAAVEHATLTEIRTCNGFKETNVLLAFFLFGREMTILKKEYSSSPA